MKPLFEIGQEVWIASANSTEKWIQCPDCCGKKFLTIIMGDGSQHTIDCSHCSRGYNGPSGAISAWEYGPHVESRMITRIEFSAKETIYWCDCQGFKSENVFAEYGEASTRAGELVSIHTAAEQRDLARKHDANKTWARNASYHRDQIRNHAKEIKRHQAKLEACLVHVKERAGSVEAPAVVEAAQ